MALGGPSSLFPVKDYRDNMPLLHPVLTELTNKPLPLGFKVAADPLHLGNQIVSVNQDVRHAASQVCALGRSINSTSYLSGASIKQSRLPEDVVVGPSVTGTLFSLKRRIIWSRSSTSKARCTRSSGTLTWPPAGNEHISITSSLLGTERKTSSEPRGERLRFSTVSPRIST